MLPFQRTRKNHNTTQCTPVDYWQLSRSFVNQAQQTRLRVEAAFVMDAARSNAPSSQSTAKGNLVTTKE
jgi:hypothetical protein